MLWTILLLLGSTIVSADEPAKDPVLRMAITFDDLPAQRAGSYPIPRSVSLNERIVEALVKAKAPAVGFVNEGKVYLDGKSEEQVPELVAALELWLDSGLELGNHTYSHPDLHQTPLKRFQQNVLRGEQITRPMIEKRDGELRWFRHPYLHAGQDLETKQGLETFLAEHGYRIAPVTIDNSEWIFAMAYDRAIHRGDEELRERIGDSYIEYMIEIVAYFEEQSRRLFDREIAQILLVHSNDLNADRFGELMERIEARGYEWIDVETAMEDPAYESVDTYVGGGGITWLHRWALSRDVDRKMFQGYPTTPEWIQDVAGFRE